MRVQVRYFAAVREIIGDNEALLELPEYTTINDLWERLAATHPRLQQLTCTAALNQEYVSPEAVIEDGDEVVFIPPVSGGALGLWNA
ncbi:MAG: molybdopterin converting factor subunit 1 [Dehalococcoidia bacterium]|nr:molybdopterin converting factor subunit 1 [Dehalococcoidia bacterium]